jgi:hypothetical protein
MLFGDPECRCAGAPEMFSAALEQRDVELCPVHQQAEIPARKTEKEARAAAAEAARAEQLLHELRGPRSDPEPEPLPLGSDLLLEHLASVVGASIDDGPAAA